MDKPLRLYPPYMASGRTLGVAVGLILAALVVAIPWFRLTPLQRYYLPAFVRVSLRCALPSRLTKTDRPDTYVLLTDQRLLVGQPKGIMPLCFANSRLVTDSRQVPLTACSVHWSPEVFRRVLRAEFYPVGLRKMWQTPALLALGFLVCPFLIGAAYDGCRKRDAGRDGIQVAGPHLMTQRQYNRQMCFGRDALRIVTVSKTRKADF